MSVENFLPLALARKALALQSFSTTNTKNTGNGMKDGPTHGTATEKRDAAKLWLSYIGEGMTLAEASATLRANHSEFTPNDVATGIWAARQCLRRGYAQALSAGEAAPAYKRVRVPRRKFMEVVKILELRPRTIPNTPGEPLHGHASRGAWATFGTDELLTVEILKGDPRLDRIVRLTSTS